MTFGGTGTGLFGGGGSSTGFSFGNTAKTTASGFGGFNTATTSASTGFTFGGTSTASTGFGGGFSGFGATTSTAATGFGAAGQTGGLFNQPNQQQQQQNAPIIDDSMSQFLNTTLALSAPVVFEDERDALLAKWNQIQVFWGNGKGYYKKDAPPVSFNTKNQYCRFKAVGYSILPTAKDEQGLVSIVIKKKESEVRPKQDSLATMLHGIFQSKPNLSVKIDSIRELPNDKTEVTVYVEEQSGVTGIAKRVPASELHAHMSQTSVLQQIKQKMDAIMIVPRAQLSPTKVRQLLENAPVGIDPLIWKQANIDNPNPSTLIPVPMLGFAKLHERLKHQELMADQHRSTLSTLSEKLEKLQQMQIDTHSTIEAHKRSLLSLSHRVLRVLASQEVLRKAGYAIQPEEEQLRVQLEVIANELTSPNQFKGRLNELLSQMRLQHHHHSIVSNQPELIAPVDDEALLEIKTMLKKQQEGLNTLISVIKEDFQDLKIIEKGILTNNDQTIPYM